MSVRMWKTMSGIVLGTNVFGPKAKRLPSMTAAARKRFSTQHRSEMSAHVVPPPSDSPATPIRARSMRRAYFPASS